MYIMFTICRYMYIYNSYNHKNRVNGQNYDHNNNTFKSYKIVIYLMHIHIPILRDCIYILILIIILH